MEAEDIVALYGVHALELMHMYYWMSDPIRRAVRMQQILNTLRESWNITLEDDPDAPGEQVFTGDAGEPLFTI